MKINACPKCGSRNISQGALGEGILTGYVNRDVCKDCGYQGMPIVFDSEEEYKKFLEGLSKDKETKTDKSGKIVKNKVEEKPLELTKNEKELLEFLDESPDKNNSELFKQKRPYGLIILVFITIFYSMLLTAWIIYYPYALGLNVHMWLRVYDLLFLSVSVFSIIAIPYCFLKGKELAYTLSGTLFIFALPLGLFFLYYLTRPHVKAHFGIT